jgi:putative ABC transport system substrate-binding protein
MVYRWGENQIDRLPALAAELVQRRVNLIVAVAPAAVLAAKAATTTVEPIRSIPILALARAIG